MSEILRLHIRRSALLNRPVLDAIMKGQKPARRTGSTEQVSVVRSTGGSNQSNLTDEFHWIASILNQMDGVVDNIVQYAGERVKGGSLGSDVSEACCESKSFGICWTFF